MSAIQRQLLTIIFAFDFGIRDYCPVISAAKINDDAAVRRSRNRFFVESSVFGRSYVHEAPRNTALSSPDDFDVPGEEGSSGGVSFSGRIIPERASERSMRRSLPFSETAISIEPATTTTMTAVSRFQRAQRYRAGCATATAASGFMVRRGASVVRGAIKSVTTSPSAGFCEPLWRFEHQHQSERTPSLRRSPVNSISNRSTERPHARHSFFSRSSSRSRAASLRFSLLPGLRILRPAKNSIVTQYGNIARYNSVLSKNK